MSVFFCCLVFFVVRAFGVLFFAVWAGATPLPKQQKRKHAPTRTAKNTRPPLEQQQKKSPLLICSTPKLDFRQKIEGATRKGSFFVAVWAGGRVSFFFCLAAGRGACFIVAVWAGCVFHFFLFGRGRVVFFAAWAGTGVHSLTGLPGWASRGLTIKRPNSKQKNGFPLNKNPVRTLTAMENDPT